MAADEPEVGSDEISDALFEEAARWFARLRDPELRPALRDKFQHWLAVDSHHAAAYEQASRLWGALDAPAKAATAENEAAIEALIASATRRKSKPLVRNCMIGLPLILVLTTGYWWQGGGLDDLRATHVTAPGGYRHDVLEDGTSIDLNTDTSLAIEMQPDRRAIRMFRGEAFFNVAHEARRPFVVTTPDGQTQDIGTAFNVRIKHGKTIVSLVEGAAVVTAASDPSSRASLHPGEQIELSRSGTGAPKRFDPSSTTAWKTGQMVFFQTPLGAVVDELNRYQRGRIMILSDRLRALPVTGVFSTRHPAEAIDIIKATLGVSSFRVTDAVIVLR